MMTVDELILKLRRVDFDTIERDLRALVLTETQRCAALAEAAGDKDVAKLILGSSPHARRAER